MKKYVDVLHYDGGKIDEKWMRKFLRQRRKFLDLSRLAWKWKENLGIIRFAFSTSAELAQVWLTKIAIRKYDRLNLV